MVIYLPCFDFIFFSKTYMKRKKMRIRSMVHPFTALMVALIFSMPLPTRAQQQSVQTETEVATEQDSSSMMREAKVAAERDASNDINKLSWFGAGVGTLAAGCLGGIVGCLVGDLIAPRDSSEPSGLMPFDDISGGAVSGGCVGFAVGLILPIRAIYKYQSSPPPERLIGKSPEYVEFYTNAYAAKSRSLRTKWAAAPVLLLGLVPSY